MSKIGKLSNTETAGESALLFTWSAVESALVFTLSAVARAL
jgi:hypothetical protein